jgi:hypothetical protein
MSNNGEDLSKKTDKSIPDDSLTKKEKQDIEEQVKAEPITPEQKDELFVSYIYSKIPPWGKTALGALAGAVILGSIALSIVATFGGTAIIGAVVAAAVVGGVGGSQFPKIAFKSISVGTIVGAIAGGVAGAALGFGIGVIPGVAIGASIGTAVNTTIKLTTGDRIHTNKFLFRSMRHFASKLGSPWKEHIDERRQKKVDELTRETQSKKQVNVATRQASEAQKKQSMMQRVVSDLLSPTRGRKQTRDPDKPHRGRSAPAKPSESSRKIRDRSLPPQKSQETTTPTRGRTLKRKPQHTKRSKYPTLP